MSLRVIAMDAIMNDRVEIKVQVVFINQQN